MDHCRIGSLETFVDDPEAEAKRSLPHRQLRKWISMLTGWRD